MALHSLYFNFRKINSMTIDFFRSVILCYFHLDNLYQSFSFCLFVIFINLNVSNHSCLIRIGCSEIKINQSKLLKARQHLYFIMSRFLASLTLLLSFLWKDTFAAISKTVSSLSQPPQFLYSFWIIMNFFGKTFLSIQLFHFSFPNTILWLIFSRSWRGFDWALNR